MGVRIQLPTHQELPVKGAPYRSAHHSPAGTSRHQAHAARLSQQTFTSASLQTALRKVPYRGGSQLIALSCVKFAFVPRRRLACTCSRWSVRNSGFSAVGVSGAKQTTHTRSSDGPSSAPLSGSLAAGVTSQGGQHPDARGWEGPNSLQAAAARGGQDLRAWQGSAARRGEESDALQDGGERSREDSNALQNAAARTGVTANAVQDAAAGSRREGQALGRPAASEGKGRGQAVAIGRGRASSRRRRDDLAGKFLVPGDQDETPTQRALGAPAPVGGTSLMAPSGPLLSRGAPAESPPVLTQTSMPRPSMGIEPESGTTSGPGSPESPEATTRLAAGEGASEGGLASVRQPPRGPSPRGVSPRGSRPAGGPDVEARNTKIAETLRVLRKKRGEYTQGRAAQGAKPAPGEGVGEGAGPEDRGGRTPEAFLRSLGGSPEQASELWARSLDTQVRQLALRRPPDLAFARSLLPSFSGFVRSTLRAAL